LGFKIYLFQRMWLDFLHINLLRVGVNLRFRVQGLGFRVQGGGLRVEG
jgi:hypothetical protein